MTPLTQTILADPARDDGHDSQGRPGDCLRTAIASLLDLDPVDVPHFAAYDEDEWWEAMRAWARRRGGEFVYLPLPIPEDWKAWWGEQSARLEHVILGGPSPRGSFGHVVIGTPDLQMVHDPHPSGSGLLAVEELFIYVPGGVS